MHRSLRIALAATVLASAALIPLARASAAETSVHVRGSVVSVSATSFVVKTATGTMTVALTPKTGYAGAIKGTTADITPGAFLGIASVPFGRTSRALEVTVFPEAMRGAGEGDYPWDLHAGSMRSSMTNGAASGSSSGSTMTNGAVKSGAGGSTMTIAYKGGTRTVFIPPTVPVVKLAPGQKNLLVPAAHVFVIARQLPSGPAATFIVVGQNGTIPPM